MKKVVLIRHGESTWNKENRFTGWHDVSLSEKGHQEAIEGGALLTSEGYTFDMAYTSLLTRAIQTLNHVLEEMSLLWIPVSKRWELNERHYGSLQGLNKKETADKFGSEQVLVWRRSYATPPPGLEETDERYPGRDPRYYGVPNLPRTECLKDTYDRVVPFWNEEVKPLVESGKNILIAAHGNSLRALVKYLDDISEDDIVHLNIPTGIPLVYEFDDSMKVVSHRYLGDPEKARKAAEVVASQTSKN